MLSLAGAHLIVALTGENSLHLLGRLTVYSAALYLTTVLFAFASVAGALSVWRARKQSVRPLVLAYFAFVAGALLMASCYLGYWGMIGLRTWA